MLATADAEAALTHSYSFNQGVQDSIGNADGTLFGNATTNALGQLVLPGGSGDYLGFDAAEIGISSYTDLTIESWFTVDNHQTWARVFDYGDRDVANEGYVYYAPQSGFGGGDALARYTTLNDQTNATHSSPQTDQQHHLAFVVDDNANGGSDELLVYLNGQLATSLGHSKSLSDVIDTYAYLGRSTAPGNDPYLDGFIDEFRIYDHALSLEEVEDNFAEGPTPLASIRLEVNTVTGAATITSDSLITTPIDYYAIRSDNDELSVAGWDSLDAQGIDVMGPNAGQSWEEADLVDSDVLGELFLLGASEVASDAPLEIGRPFDTSVFGLGQDGDLDFEFGIEGGGILDGDVVYFTPVLPDGDYDGDLDVDGYDFIKWQRGLSFDPLSPTDLAAWESNFGTVPMAAAAASVPEPTACYLVGCGLVVYCHRSRRESRSRSRR